MGISLSMAQMAKDVLAVPISSVSVERTFHIARQVCIVSDPKHLKDNLSKRQSLRVAFRSHERSAKQEACEIQQTEDYQVLHMAVKILHISR